MEKKLKIKADAERGVRRIDDKFGAAAAQVEKDRDFRAATVGLVTAEDFRKLQALQQRKDSGGEEMAAEEARLAMASGTLMKKKKGEKKRKKAMMAVLSFGGGDDGDDQDDGDQDDGDGNDINSKKASKKDTSVDTSFLPDKDRAFNLASAERALKKEWTFEQSKIKAQKLEVTYSYWDGTGHRREIVVTKGMSVGEFLEETAKVRGEEEERARERAREG